MDLNCLAFDLDVLELISIKSLQRRFKMSEKDDTVEREYTGVEIKDKYFPNVDWDTLREKKEGIYEKLGELTDENLLQIKTCTPKPKAPEPMEVTTGFYMTFDKLYTYIKYSIASLKKLFFIKIRNPFDNKP